jgi:hypothetical protein
VRTLRLAWEHEEPPRSPNTEVTETLELIQERDAEDRLLPPAEVARLLGVDPRTLGDWDRAGKLRAAQRTLGGHRRYWESDVRALIAGLEAVA